MNKFTYWDNSKAAHGVKLLEVFAENIIDADKIFQLEKGINPISKTTISVTIE